MDGDGSKVGEEEEKFVEEFLAEREDLAEEDARERESRRARMLFYAKLFNDEENSKWRDLVTHYKQYKVLKMPRVMQSVFYFLGYNREDVCEIGTNKLNWKKAKLLLKDEFFKRILDYNPIGPKPEHYKGYWRINFIEKFLEGITQEDVDNYSVGIGKLFKWLQLAIAVRKEDVKYRLSVRRKKEQERNDAKTKEEERVTARTNYIEEERKKWTEEREGQEPTEGAEPEEFNEAAAGEKFDEDNPPGEIPPVVEEEIENDVEIVEDENAEGD